MELTMHGVKRIQGRTKMLARDVLQVIEGKAFVSLGDTDQYEYILFYSPPDRRCKIGVLSLDRATLVSIWEKDYHLPEAVSKPTRKHALEARELLQEFLKERIVASSPPQLPIYCSLELLEQGKNIYSAVLGDMPERLDRPQILVHFKETLRPIAEAVEETKEHAIGKVAYRFTWVNNLGYKRTWTAKHETVLRYTRAA